MRPESSPRRPPQIAYDHCSVHMTDWAITFGWRSASDLLVPQTHQERGPDRDPVPRGVVTRDELSKVTGEGMAPAAPSVPPRYP